MKEAGLIEKPHPGYLKVTDSGPSLLEEEPKSIGSKFFERYPEFVAVRRKSGKSVEPKPQTVAEEAIDDAYQTIRNSLATELLQQIKGCSQQFFENLVVDLLVKRGYGGTRKDAGAVLGMGGDEG